MSWTPRSIDQRDVANAQVSQYISAAALSGLLVSKKQLDPADLRELPPLAEIRMFLKVALLAIMAPAS